MKPVGEAYEAVGGAYDRNLRRIHTCQYATENAGQFTFMVPRGALFPSPSPKSSSHRHHILNLSP
ncbi:hypothetical protein E2C01_077273 [Portunus trituberculatus]|uniref:Uncharacterized protein n=1 Tax=Portunus trituberculatus TaxID=210409 RepID=A0A5B7IPA1_PORTR|nr:hypothetical protein [Portunus trituberculatus]